MRHVNVPNPISDTSYSNSCPSLSNHPFNVFLGSSKFNCSVTLGAKGFSLLSSSSAASSPII